MTTPPIAPSAPAPPANTSAPAETRIDVLKGDRCCAGCGFNLHGQYIVREPHYRMLIVRCPECGVAAALQEYPTVTRMAWRFRMLLGAAWLAALFAGFLATGGLIYIYGRAVMQSVISPYQNAVQSAWTEHSTKNLTPAQQAQWWNTQGIDTWWAGLPPSKFFAEFGGWGGLNWWGLCYFVSAALIFTLVGMVWSVALARLRGLRLLAVLLLPLVFTLFFAFDDFFSINGMWFLGAQYLAQRQIGWLPMGLAVVACTAFLFAAALAGRILARAFLRLVLPARLLAAFSFLWITDGKDLPKPAAVHPPRRG